MWPYTHIAETLASAFLHYSKISICW